MPGAEPGPVCEQAACLCTVPARSLQRVANTGCPVLGFAIPTPDTGGCQAACRIAPETRFLPATPALKDLSILAHDLRMQRWGKCMDIPRRSVASYQLIRPLITAVVAVCAMGGITWWLFRLGPRRRGMKVDPMVALRCN